ncbi:Uncharacterized protein PBTT_05791 [Plasmodiophora brassicae]
MTAGVTSVNVVSVCPSASVGAESTAWQSSPSGESWTTILWDGLKLFLLIISAPCLIATFFAGIHLAPATRSFDSSQWPWVGFFAFLNTSWFVVLPCAISNLLIDKPGCHRHDITVMVLCGFLNLIIPLAIPYALNVYPVFFSGYISTTVLSLISRRLHFVAMGKSDERDRPCEELRLPPNKVLRLRSLTSASLTVYLLIVVLSLVCFVLVSSSAVLLQSIAGFATGSISLAGRLAIPYVLFDRMRLDQNRQLHLDPNIRAYYAFHLEVTSEVYFSLAFPMIENLGVFGVVVAVQMASMILSSMWLFPQLANWMSANPNPQSPWSQIGIVTKLGVRLLRPSQSTSVHSMEKWHDVARLVVFMRWLAKLTATISFTTLYSLAYFTYNGRYMAFQAKDDQQYWRVMAMSLISLVCENIALIGMSIFSTFAVDAWRDPNSTSFFARGFQLLKTDYKAPFFLFATMFTNMSIAIAMFIQQTNWLYELYSIH